LFLEFSFHHLLTQQLLPHLPHQKQQHQLHLQHLPRQKQKPLLQQLQPRVLLNQDYN
jgi:hypothetical protein